MPNVADFVTVQDHGSLIPVPNSPANGVQFPLFDAPAANGAPAVLIFRLSVEGEIVLQAALNGTHLFQRELSSGPDRSWHEVISTPGLVHTTDNDLEITVQGDGSAVVSDIVLMYQAQV